MTLYICYLFIYTSEAFISYYYFGSKYKPKVSSRVLVFIYTLLGLISFTVSRIDNIPLINVITFIISNFLILTFCYSTNIKSRIYTTIILTATMIVSETIVMNVMTILFDANLYDISHNTFYLITLSALSKLLYFLAIYLFTKFITKEKEHESHILPIFLSILPISSVIWMISTYYLTLVYDVSEFLKNTLSFCNILVLLSNIVVFFVYEQTLKTNRLNTELLLTKQKEQNIADYYKLLKEQNENSKILIHDITKHLNSINMLSNDSDIDIKDYISHIIEDFNIMNPIDYCSNSLLNLITNRYSIICKSENINFDINIQNAKIDFMSEPDITALFDNILENAVESARQTSEKIINFSIDIRNTNFVVINVSNTSNKKPISNNGIIISSKIDPAMHGIGTKSIKRVIKKYDGIMNMDYNEEEKTFKTIITFQL